MSDLHSEILEALEPFVEFVENYEDEPDTAYFDDAGEITMAKLRRLKKVYDALNTPFYA